MVKRKNKRDKQIKLFYNSRTIATSIDQDLVGQEEPFLVAEASVVRIDVKPDQLSLELEGIYLRNDPSKKVLLHSIHHRDRWQYTFCNSFQSS
jgi:hypothetical protein